MSAPVRRGTHLHVHAEGAHVGGCEIDACATESSEAGMCARRDVKLLLLLVVRESLGFYHSRVHTYSAHGFVSGQVLTSIRGTVAAIAPTAIPLCDE